MLRVLTLFALASGLMSLTAFRAENPKCNNQPFMANDAAALAQLSSGLITLHLHAPHNLPAADTHTVLRVLLLDYSTYDSAYAVKMRRLVQAQMPSCTVSEFWEGTIYDLNLALATHDAVVVAYPSGGKSDMNKTYGKQLEQYVRQGGVVVFTGTDDYRVLQQFGLLDVNFGYFCQDPVIHEIITAHPILEGTKGQFTLSDYAYPLDITDPDFTTLVDVLGYDEESAPMRCWSETDEVVPSELRNFPVIGYKTLGAGKVVYLGMEYYYDQPEPTRILSNTLRWATQSKTAQEQHPLASKGDLLPNRAVKRSQEVLQAGSGPKMDAFDVKIYPNPYYEKATLDVELKASATLAVEMTDETGRIVAVVLPQKNLHAGLYRLELPNLPAGIYFVQCKTGEKVITRKVVKATAR
ncbi:MAG: T9SS type A sorting domain-containing protein [Saprospiraceae bacterium]|nr:T9SS type A sorting domain-containing protein [Saprospiraceae bacterium]